MHAQKEGRRTDNLDARRGWGWSMPISSRFTPGERDPVTPKQNALVDHGAGLGSYTKSRHHGIPTANHTGP
jgi:hypothetical protein